MVSQVESSLRGFSAKILCECLVSAVLAVCSEYFIFIEFITPTMVFVLFKLKGGVESSIFHWTYPDVRRCNLITRLTRSECGLSTLHMIPSEHMVEPTDSWHSFNRKAGLWAPFWKCYRFTFPSAGFIWKPQERNPLKCLHKEELRRPRWTKCPVVIAFWTEIHSSNITLQLDERFLRRLYASSL